MRQAEETSEVKKEMALVQVFDNDITFNLGTLAALDVVQVNSKIDGARNQGFRVVKSSVHFMMGGKTTDEGPIMIGVACNALSPEVEEIMEADPQSPSDNDERGMGVFIKPLFMITKNELELPLASAPSERLSFTFTYGKNGWSVPEDQQLAYWAYNMDDAALTTGTQLRIFAEHFGVWLRD